MQFHWENDGYASYEDYTSRFRSAMRKQVRKEREKANDAGLSLEVVEGPALADNDFAALHRFYLDTCARKGSPPYLTAGFFREVATELRPRVVAAIARKDGEPVAGSLNFEKGRCLFGRYWGALDAYDSLHFELCFHRLIERAIARGHQRFEAGAQGMHKLRRGLMPARIHSMHWVREPRLRDAVLEFLPREARAVERQILELGDHGPFRRGEP
jgi:predicted N-acyltransferase